MTLAEVPSSPVSTCQGFVTNWLQYLSAFVYVTGNTNIGVQLIMASKPDVVSPISNEFKSNTRDDTSNGTHSHSQTSSDAINAETGRVSANQKKTKFVVRKIPQFVTEDVIKGHLEEFREDYTWFLWTQQPDIPNPTRRQKSRFQRFYIRFVSFQAAIPFIEKFQKLIFKERDEEKEPDPSTLTQMERYNLKPNVGYKLCVEFAPNQGAPVVITSRDRRINTIDADDDYKAFVQGLADRKEEIEKVRKSVEANSMRTSQVVDMRSKGTATAKQKESDANTDADNAPIAPLARHVAHQRHRSLVITLYLRRFHPVFEFLKF